MMDLQLSTTLSPTPHPQHPPRDSNSHATAVGLAVNSYADIYRHFAKACFYGGVQLRIAVSEQIRASGAR